MAPQDGEEIVERFAWGEKIRMKYLGNYLQEKYPGGRLVVITYKPSDLSAEKVAAEARRGMAEGSQGRLDVQWEYLAPESDSDSEESRGVSPSRIAEVMARHGDADILLRRSNAPADLESVVAWKSALGKSSKCRVVFVGVGSWESQIRAAHYIEQDLVDVVVIFSGSILHGRQPGGYREVFQRLHVLMDKSNVDEVKRVPVHLRDAPGCPQWLKDEIAEQQKERRESTAPDGSQGGDGSGAGGARRVGDTGP